MRGRMRKITANARYMEERYGVQPWAASSAQSGVSQVIDRSCSPVRALRGAAVRESAKQLDPRSISMDGLWDS